MIDLKPCPFCGGKAYFERVGTHHCSCIVVCEDCGCRLETNEEGIFCGMQWNHSKDFIEGAEAFRKMLLSSTKSFLWALIEGVFQVFADKNGFVPREILDEVTEEKG